MMIHGLRLPKGEYVEIAIEDQGVGLPRENISKIFDPYFTTKEMSSGLGLAASYSIVKSHQGYLTVESKKEGGTTFFIYLPAFPEKMIAPQAIPVKEEAEKNPVAGKGKILVMDDQEIVRKTLGAMLNFFGYEVSFAINGGEAIEVYLKELSEINPTAKSIVSSGYSTDPVMCDCKKYGFQACLAKPYDPFTLSKTLDKVIKEV